VGISDGGRVAVIAAAGRGTRFHGEGPKVLADVGGQPCLARVLATIEAGLGEHQQIIVVGHEAEAVQAAIGDAPNRQYVLQEELRGTGDALRCGLSAVPPDAGSLYFFCGDKPLLRASTIARFREQFERGTAPMQFLTGWIEGDEDAVLANRQGRVVCVESDGRPHALAIVERKVIEAMVSDEPFRLANGMEYRFSRDQLLRIREVNVSTYAWSLNELRRAVRDLQDDNAQHEFLVTDLVHLFLNRGWPVETVALSDPEEGKGIDTREQWLEIRRS